MKKINLLYSVGLAALLIFPSCEDSWTGEEVVITELTIVNTTADNCYSDSVSVQFAAIDQDGDTTTNVWWISSNETVTVSSTGLATLSGNTASAHVMAKAVADNVTSPAVLVRYCAPEEE